MASKFGGVGVRNFTYPTDFSIDFQHCVVRIALTPIHVIYQKDGNNMTSIVLHHLFNYHQLQWKSCL